jgi:uncharacterized protein YcnI
MRIRVTGLDRFLLGTAVMLFSAGVASSHVTIWPKESTRGAREKYTMRVPCEKPVGTIRIEGEFPPEVDIESFEFKPGWKIDFKKDAKGKIVGAVWNGRIAPHEFVEFSMLGINSKEGSKLVWKFVQYYEDGEKEEFTGPAGSRLPSPVTVLNTPGAVLRPLTSPSN